MLRKTSITIVAAVFAIFLGVLPANAQTAPVSGKVELKKADGTITPVAGAVVEVYRTDIKSSLPAAKTGKNGQFSFAGLQLGAVYVLSVSAAGAQPTYLPNVKAGAENLKLTLDEGDGRKLTEAEVRTAITQGTAAGGGSSSGQLTAEQKKQMAEEQAKIDAIKAKNAKAESNNTLIAAALKEGNAAYEAKNYDVAVAKYTEGIQVDPDFAGSAPILLNNKGTVLRARAIQVYNQNVKSTDPTAKLAALKSVRQDFSDSIASFEQSWNILKTANPADVGDPKTLEGGKAGALSGAAETFRLMALTEQVDDTKTATARTMIPEYLAMETDQGKKDAAKLLLADLYRVAGDSENAIAEYKKVLETSPDNLDAMAGLGLSLVNNGYIKEDKTQLQEGANVLQRFASAAPATHKYKDDALGLIENLKNEQKIAPQKTAGAKKKN